MRPHEWPAVFALTVLTACAEAESKDESGQKACPAIGCAGALNLKLTTTLTGNQLKQGKYTACHNDECFEGPFQMLHRAGAEPPQALSAVEHEQNRSEFGGGPVLSISADPMISALWVSWNVDAAADKRGDRFKLSIELEDGRTADLLDTEVSYREEVLLTDSDCELRCVVAEPVEAE